MKIGWHNGENLGSSSMVDNYFLPILNENIDEYIRNVTTQLFFLEVANQQFPATLNHQEYQNSYVCSPYTAFVPYAKEELAKVNSSLLRAVLYSIILPLDTFLRAGKINQVIHLNNWLLSTNLYPSWSGEEIPQITQDLKAKFPEHVYIFRSLNQVTNPQLIERFHKSGYTLAPSRQVYMFNGKNPTFLEKKNTQRDLQLLSRTSYKIVNHDEIFPEDYSRIEELYKLLYLDKYSYLNPQFTAKLIQQCHQEKIWEMQGLRNAQGQLDGIVGCFSIGEVMTTPLVGYDTQVCQKQGLYRMLIAMVLKKAFEERKILNLSAGASHFKILRGGKAEIEYSAVYYRHLSWQRQICWKTLGWILMTIAAPVLRKYKL